jgi:TIGR03009 family protein
MTHAQRIWLHPLQASISDPAFSNSSRLAIRAQNAEKVRGPQTPFDTTELGRSVRMRHIGFALVASIVCATSVWAQPPGGSGLPPAQPVVPAGIAPAPATLDTHLGSWERTMTNLTNYRVDISLSRTDPTFKTENKYTGQVLCMKPNLAILRLDHVGDRTKNDYEAYLCDGKSVYQYNGLQKTVTEWKIPNPAQNLAGNTDNLILDFISGMKASEIRQRFDISLMKEDETYVYLRIMPLLGRDKQEFQQLTLALCGPKTQCAYQPRTVYWVKPNGEIEKWDFTNPMMNIPGITKDVFKYQKVEGFTERPAQPFNQQPPPKPPAQPFLPGANGLPPGPGTVRP